MYIKIVPLDLKYQIRTPILQQLFDVAFGYCLTRINFQLYKSITFDQPIWWVKQSESLLDLSKSHPIRLGILWSWTRNLWCYFDCWQGV